LYFKLQKKNKFVAMYRDEKLRFFQKFVFVV
jgi:hypothetical protein